MTTNTTLWVFYLTCFGLIVLGLACILPGIWLFNKNGRSRNSKIVLSFFSTIIFVTSVLLIYSYIGRGRELKQHYQAWQVLQQKKVDTLRPLYAQMAKDEAQIKISLADDPENVVAWWQLGKIYELREDYQQASGAYRRALNLENNNIMVINSYASVAARLSGGILDEELQKLLRWALIIEPENLTTLNLLAMHAYKTKNYKEAASLWQTMLVSMPEGFDQELQRVISEMHTAALKNI